MLFALYDFLGHDSQFLCSRIINMDGLRVNAYLHFVVQFNGNAENLHYLNRQMILRNT